jgi:hypothetical protein
MRMLLVAAVAGTILFGASAPARLAADGGGVADALPSFDALPGSTLPVLRTHEYVMSGSVRPLLFWMTRDDIGLARIIWRKGAGSARGYELIVGTDPARAPRRVNRWGLISEDVQDSGGSLLAIMTGSSDTSYEKESAAASSGGGAEFNAIRSRAEDGIAKWALLNLRAPSNFTVHEAGKLLEYASRAPERQRSLRRMPPESRPGFLVAVDDLLQQALAASQETPVRVPGSVTYVFGANTYRLTLKRAERVDAGEGDRHIPALRLSFEARTLTTGDTSRFELTTGTSGELTGVPLRIEWQPRWWLRVRLRLSELPRG